jgi:hypothetical protein
VYKTKRYDPATYIRILDPAHFTKQNSVRNVNSESKHPEVVVAGAPPASAKNGKAKK